jgi:uncharacterized protein Yka (UPF0111/DUF47 family)
MLDQIKKAIRKNVHFGTTRSDIANAANEIEKIINEGKSYIVAYTLKHNDKPDTFIDRYMRFLNDEHNGNAREAAEKYVKILQDLGMDGDQPNYHVFSIDLAEIKSSTDHF